MSRTRQISALAPAGLVLVVVAACTDEFEEPAGVVLEPAATVGAVAPAPPGGEVDVAFGPSTLRVWPFTGVDVAGTVMDPVNVLFTGEVDVLSLRAALVGLDGDRTAFGFPNAFPFNCRWTDASGGVQTVWSDQEGWVANSVQLECGGYDPIRFHVRLFPAGDWVVAGVHMDLLIPGTPQHQVISWELAKQFLTVDLLRSGVLDPAAPLAATSQINPAPSFQQMPGIIYDGIPPSLKALLGGPPSSGGLPVPIPSTGRATVFNVAVRTPVTDDFTQSDFELPFSQGIPRPFCPTGPTDGAFVDGPIRITTRTQVTAAGGLSTHNTVRAEVLATPIDLATQQPTGEPFRVLIENLHETRVTPAGGSVNILERILAIPPSQDGRGSLMTHLITGPNGLATYTRRERC